MGLHVVLACIDTGNMCIWLTGFVLDDPQHEVWIAEQVSTESVTVVYVLLNSVGQFFSAIEDLWIRVHLLQGIENVADPIDIARGPTIFATQVHPDC
jgi:hypothetical protein